MSSLTKRSLELAKSPTLIEDKPFFWQCSKTILDQVSNCLLHGMVTTQICSFILLHSRRSPKTRKNEWLFKVSCGSAWRGDQDYCNLGRKMMRIHYVKANLLLNLDLAIAREEKEHTPFFLDRQDYKRGLWSPQNGDAWLKRTAMTSSTPICPLSKSMDSFTNAKGKWYKNADVTRPVSSGFRRGAEGCRKEGKRVARVCQLAVRHRPHPDRP